MPAEVDRVAALERSILSAAFRGKLVSQDPHDELVSAVPERIRARRLAAGKMGGTQTSLETSPARINPKIQYS